MLDHRVLRGLRPLLTLLAQHLVARGVSANGLTAAGLVSGLAAAAAIAVQQPLLGLGLMLLSRLCDGLDGTLARLTQPTDRGAFFDIVCDMLFYASVPLAFALADPARNALAAALLLAAFIGTSASFLAFAVMAERRGLENLAELHKGAQNGPQKGLYYLGGLTEGFETVLCFALMCWWPAHFASLALGFAALCGVTLLTRLWTAWRVLR